MSRACSASRGPKPPIAPKPKVPHDLDGRDPLLSSTQDGCVNGSLLASDDELDQETEPEDSLSGGVEDKASLEWQIDFYFLNSRGKELLNGSQEQGTEEEVREEEEEMMQEMEEEWISTESALTEEVDSLDMLGVSDAGFTADALIAVEMIDTDLTEDMDAEGCDAGEALADTDGLSVGEFSVTSIEEEEAASYSCEKVSELEDREMKEREGRLQSEEEEAADSTADVLTESLTEEPVVVLVSENLGDILTQQSSSFMEGEEEEEELSSGHGISCNALVLECNHETIGSCQPRDPGSHDDEVMEIPSYLSIQCSGCLDDKGESSRLYSVIDEAHMNIYDNITEHQKQLLDTDEGPVTLEADPTLEPYYISSEDIIDRELSPTDHTAAHGVRESELTPQETLSVNTNEVLPSEYETIRDEDSLCEESEDNGQIECMSSEDYVEIGRDDEDDNDDSDENMTRPCQRRTSVNSEGDRAQMEALQNHSNCQPRFRLVSISLPRDTDTSLTSSLSDSQLLSPNDSDSCRDEEELEGHIVPFLDETTDVEHDLSDEHVYEEAGLDSESENVAPFDRKAIVMRSCSLSGKPDYVPETVPEERGSEFDFRKYCMGRFDQAGPVLNSSPLLNAVRAKSYSKPQRFSMYPRSFSMEGQDMPLCVYKERKGSPRERAEDSLSLPFVFSSSGSFSQRSPLPSSGLSTPTSMVDIPPPFELAYITKKPITKSSPSLLIEGDSPEKNKKKKSSFKRFLMLKFRRKTESKLVVDINPSSSRSSPESSQTPSRLLDLDRRNIGSSPQLKSHSVSSKPQRSPESPTTFLLYKDGKRKGGSVAFLNRSVARVESFEDRSRVPFMPLPLTKPRSISFPNTDTSDYENIPAISSDYENIQVLPQRAVRQGTFTEFFDHTSRALSSAHETDGYVDMSSFPGFESRALPPEETERYGKHILCV